MSKIAVNGCSFTEEGYLAQEHRWSNRIGCHKNLAHGGGSNDRIFYTTIQYLNEHKPNVVIIGWSNPVRFMLPNKNGSRIVITPTHTFDENLSGDYTRYSDFYYRNCHNIYDSFERTLNYMLHIQNYCKSRQIKLLYFNALLPDIDNESLLKYSEDAFMSKENKDMVKMGVNFNHNKISNLINRLDKSIWIKEFWYSMLEHCKDFPSEKDGHPGIQGSNHWATLVADHL
jgi:hypothetical protein